MQHLIFFLQCNGGLLCDEGLHVEPTVVFEKLLFFVLIGFLTEAVGSFVGIESSVYRGKQNPYYDGEVV